MGESHSNGIIKRAVGLVAGQARTPKSAQEHLIGTSLPPDARILCRMVEFATHLMNRCDICSDGETPLQGLHGRKDNTPILEFGEKILFMPAKPARGGKWEPRFHPGVFVRRQRQWLSPSKGCRSRHAQRTSGQSLSRRGGTRTEYTGCEPFHGLRMAATMHSISKPEWRGPRRPRLPGEVLMENKVARTYLRRADFEQWPGWYVRTGQGRQQAHSEACRRRIGALLRSDSSGSARFAVADERINHALADAVEGHATKDPGTRGKLKRSCGVCHAQSEPQKKIAMERTGLTTTHSSLPRRIIKFRCSTQRHRKQ